MHNPIVIIVTGPPGAGKTTLAKRLARALSLPLIDKDSIKEILFDTIGWRDREWSMKLGGASFEILFHLLESQLEAKKSAVVETAFIPRFHTARFLELEGRYGFEPIQVLCTANATALFERFKRRVASGERHPGHVDHLMAYEPFAEAMESGKYGVLEIGGPVLEVDTTDLEQVDYQNLVENVASICNGHRDGPSATPDGEW